MLDLAMLQGLYGAERLLGYTEADIACLKGIFGGLPQSLEDYYRAAGRTKALLAVQDTWMMPEHFRQWPWLRECDHLIVLNENQGVCRAGVRRDDLALADPPVYVTYDDGPWTLCAPSVSDFLAGALAYEAVLVAPFAPEHFYWLTKEELDWLAQRLSLCPFQLVNWLQEGMRISFYRNAPDNLAFVMDNGDLQLYYGAVSQSAYDQLAAVLGAVGEPV